MKQTILFIFLTFLLISKSYSASFSALIDQVEQHSALKVLTHKKEATLFEGQSKSAWNDPVLRLDASNFPIENLEFNQTPLTGIQMTLSQAIPITDKYNNLKKSYVAKTQAIEYSKEILKRRLVSQIWRNAILKEKIIKENKILAENMVWLKHMIRVSNNRYANGKLSQQAILDLKIRTSQIKTDIQKNQEQLKQLQIRLAGILDSENYENEIDLNTVPWFHLNSDQQTITEMNTPEAAMLVQEEQATKFMARSEDDSRTPDITFGLSYRYRNNIDSVGDFIGIFVSVPLSFTNHKQSSSLKSALEKEYAAQTNLSNYLTQLKVKKVKLESEIKEVTTELKILKLETIQFAQTSRKITAKAYQVGQSSYIELLKSELQLQNVLLQKANLEADLKMKKLSYLFEMGLPLKPGEKIL